MTIKDAFARSVLLHKVCFFSLLLLIVLLFQSPQIGFLNVDIERSPGTTLNTEMAKLWVNSMKNKRNTRGDQKSFHLNPIPNAIQQHLSQF